MKLHSAFGGLVIDKLLEDSLSAFARKAWLPRNDGSFFCFYVIPGLTGKLISLFVTFATSKLLAAVAHSCMTPYPGLELVCEDTNQNTCVKSFLEKEDLGGLKPMRLDRAGIIVLFTFITGITNPFHF